MSKCMDCYWWKTSDRKGKEAAGVLQISKGSCRLSAPRLVQWGDAGDLNYDTKWPTTDGGDYCGQWQPAEDRAARLLTTKYMSASNEAQQ